MCDRHVVRVLCKMKKSLNLKSLNTLKSVQEKLCQKTLYKILMTCFSDLEILSHYKASLYFCFKAQDTCLEPVKLFMK